MLYTDEEVKKLVHGTLKRDDELRQQDAEKEKRPKREKDGKKRSATVRVQAWPRRRRRRKLAKEESKKESKKGSKKEKERATRRKAMRAS